MKRLALMFFFFLMLFSCEKDNDSGQPIYLNSFESQSDTAGWIGYAFNFSNDVPAFGGKKSLSVSGGCVVPHAEYIVPPQNTDCYLIIKFQHRDFEHKILSRFHVMLSSSRQLEQSMRLSTRLRSSDI